MKVLYLKDNYDIWLKITVPDVAYLKRVKPVQTDSLYILETHPHPPPSPPKKDKLRYACPRMFTGPYARFFHQGAVSTRGATEFNIFDPHPKAYISVTHGCFCKAFVCKHHCTTLNWLNRIIWLIDWWKPLYKRRIIPLNSIKVRGQKPEICRKNSMPQLAQLIIAFLASRHELIGPFALWTKFWSKQV
jgi:hypothetical protein